MVINRGFIFKTNILIYTKWKGRSALFDQNTILNKQNYLNGDFCDIQLKCYYICEFASNKKFLKLSENKDYLY